MLLSEETFPREKENFGSTKVSMLEKLLKSKKRDLIDSLSLTEDGACVVLWSKHKVQLGKSRRGSKYRGVSRNGKKWQVQLLGSLRKRYIGSIGCEEQAARIYDRYAIINQGTRAKTNFNYTKEEVLRIIDAFTEDDLVNPAAKTEFPSYVIRFPLSAR